MIVLIEKGQKTKNRKLIRMEIDYDFEQEEANKIRSVNVNVEGQSLSFWILLTVGLISMIGQQIGLIKYRNANSYTGIVFQILNTSLAAAMLIAVLVFS